MLTTPKPTRSPRGVTLALALMTLLGACMPPGPRALLDGERLLLDGRPADAVRRLRRAVEFLPANPQAWNHLGLAHHAAGETGEASEAYQHALRLAPNLAVVHYNLGCLWLENGNPARAIESLRTFVGLQPQSVEGWRRLGQAQLRLRQWDLAEGSFANALRVAPGDAESLNGVGIACQQRNRPRDAWRCFTNSVFRDPKFAPAWLNLAVIAQQAGGHPQAAEAYRQYATLRPEAARRLGLAEIIRRLDQPTAPNVAPVALASASRRPARSVADELPPAEPPAPPALATSSTPSNAVVIAPTSDVPEPDSSTLPNPGNSRPPVAAPEIATIPPRQEPPQVPSGTSPATTPLPPTTPDPAFVSSIPSTSPQGSTASTPPPTSPTLSTNSTTSPSSGPTPGVATIPPPRPSISFPVPSSSSVALEVVVLPAETSTTIAQVRDIDATPAPPPTAATTVPPSSSAPAPLIRPVTEQREAREGAEPPKRGFWARANPVNWFSSDEPADTTTSATESAASNPADSASTGADSAGSSAWIWNNPSSWFRGKPESQTTPDATSSAPPPVTSATTAAPIPPASRPSASLQVASVPPVVPSTPKPATTTTPSSVEPLAPRPKPVPQYAYRNPPTPPAGNRPAARNLVLQATQEQRLNRLDVAAQLYRDAIRVDPACVEAHRGLAFVAYRMGNANEALEAGEMALALDPASDQARFNFALALDRAGFPREAAAEAGKVLTALPNDVATHLLLGNLYSQKLGAPDRARDHYLKVIELDPQHPQNLAIRRWLATRR